MGGPEPVRGCALRAARRSALARALSLSRISRSRLANDGRWLLMSLPGGYCRRHRTWANGIARSRTRRCVPTTTRLGCATLSFATAHPALQRTLAARSYVEPTSVQLAVLAEGARDRDLLVSAQTGSGKTVAFGMVVAQSLLAGAETFAKAAAPRALIVTPTRELAQQVCRELTWLFAETGARIASCVGGMDPR